MLGLWDVPDPLASISTSASRSTTGTFCVRREFLESGYGKEEHGEEQRTQSASVRLHVATTKVRLQG